MTLKDVKLIRTKGDMSCGAVNLYLFGANAANLKIDDDQNPFDGEEASFMYLDPVECEEIKSDEPETYGYLVPGWYHQLDEEWEYPMDNFPLSYGLGYAVKAFADNYEVQWAGQVETDANMPVIALNKNDFTWTGNAAPTKLALKDFVLSRTKGDMSCGAVNLYFFGANAANLKIDDDQNPFDGEEASFMYLDPVECEEIKSDEPEAYDYLTPGWYHQLDEEWEYPMNDYPVDASHGFSVKAFAENYQFQLPGAL